MIPCGPAPSEEKKKSFPVFSFFFLVLPLRPLLHPDIIIPDLTVRATLHFGRTQMELEIQASPRTLRSPEFRERSDLRRGRVESKAPPGGGGGHFLPGRDEMPAGSGAFLGPHILAMLANISSAAR